MTATHIADRRARAELARLMERFARRPRPIHVVKKSAYWHQRAAGAALFAVTFGGQDKYLSHYVTTLGHTIYVPDDFYDWAPTRALEILRHEAVHVAQFERYGFLVMVLFYGILPLPMGLAWFRARLEWEAYEETLRAVAEVEGLAAARDPALREEIVRRFTGPDYGWMWPFPRTIERWIDAALVKIEGELAQSEPSTPSAEKR